MTKPRDDYAGHGVVVYERSQAEFHELIFSDPKQPFVVQKYVHNPLLIGGYKFHIRVYLVITSMFPLKAFVNRAGHILFATGESVS